MVTGRFYASGGTPRLCTLWRASLGAAAMVLGLALLPSGVVAKPAGAGGPPLILEVRPGGGPQRTGEPQTVEARVTLPNKDGVDDVVVDFEVTEGPGDNDIGTAGHTPDAPDMSCTTAGGGSNRAATCVVEYTEQDNEGGSDGVLAWIDVDSLDATVEADLAEGENQHAAGAGACSAGSKGPGLVSEPDQTDCAEERWTARVPATVDVEAEAGSAPVGSGGSVDATVFDQFGDLFAGVGRTTIVSLELLAGSVHDPGDGSDFSSPDLGSCDTGATGICSLAFGSSHAGLDSLCGYLPAMSAACSEPLDAPALADGADVVHRLWSAPAPSPAPDPPPVPAPPAPAPASPPAVVAPPATSSPTRAEDGLETRDDRGRQDGGVMGPVAAAIAPLLEDWPGATAPAAARFQPKPSSEQGRRSTRHRPDSRDGAGAGRRGSGPARRPTRARRGDRRGERSERVAPSRLRRRLGELSEVAVTTAERFSFPLGLALFVLGFIGVQGRIDRRDPKLRLAPLDSKHDLVSFA